MKRLLLDQGVPRTTVRVLKAEGWEVVHVADIGMSKASDRAILEFGERDNRVCVTLDADFHAILAVANARKPSVIRIRREGLDGERLARPFESDLAPDRSPSGTWRAHYRHGICRSCTTPSHLAR